MFSFNSRLYNVINIYWVTSVLYDATSDLLAKRKFGLHSHFEIKRILCQIVVGVLSYDNIFDCEMPMYKIDTLFRIMLSLPRQNQNNSKVLFNMSLKRHVLTFG